ncbi:MAG: hypothetical protein HC769_19330 [Cyanobacteria bacterium CRU_2_1]|nr:hypothetical protein [Cyanobacteria bacterium RU_5_0]NJR60780.1 hypothetical protein [Cyanobacteria bacterium CRU_2_1]
MRTINLAEEMLDLKDLIYLAQQEPVLLLTPDGQEFLLAEADDFEQEVEILRASHAFQQFLNTRSANPSRINLDDFEREIDQELAAQQFQPNSD